MSLEPDSENTSAKPGLLNRARLLRGSNFRNDTTPLSTPKIEEFDNISDSENIFDINKFNARVSELNDGLELPTLLFDIIRDALKIETGALLLWDSVGEVFAPWSSINFDKTTSHRLRISKELLENIQSGFTGPVIIKKPDLDNFKPYFSMRIFDMTDKAALLPIYKEKNLLGIIIILDSDILPENIILNTFNSFTSTISDLLFSSRFLNLNHFKSGRIIAVEDIQHEIDSRIEQTLTRNDRLTLIIINLENILEFLKEKNKELDLFRVKNDILAILNSMVEGIGEVLNIDTTRALLFLSSKTSIKDKVLLNQISLSLQSFFQYKENFPPLSAIIRRIPEDGMDSDTIMDQLV